MPLELMSLRPYLLTYRYGGRVNSYMFYSHAAPPRWLYISKRGDVVMHSRSAILACQRLLLACLLGVLLLWQ